MDKSIRETFGLDYILASGTAPTSPSGVSSPAVGGQAAILGGAVGSTAGGVGGPLGDTEFLMTQARQYLWMAQILKQLQVHAPDFLGRLHDLVESTGIDLIQLLQVVDVMNSYGLVVITQQDKLGNLEIRMTDQGRQFLTGLAS